MLIYKKCKWCEGEGQFIGPPQYPRKQKIIHIYDPDTALMECWVCDGVGYRVIRQELRGHEIGEEKDVS